MAKKWINHLGQEVPATYVPKIDKQKERTALKFAKQADTLNARLKKFKTELIQECDKIYNEMCADADITVGEKGNYSITSFDKEIKIEISIQERIEFNDKINLAQAKINEFLTEKTAGVDRDIQLLINSAFQTTKGRLDTKRILGLFKLNIRAKKWNDAMELIKQSIERNTSRRYIRIWRKDNAGTYQGIDLNFSSIETA